MLSHCLDGELLLKIPCWDRGHHSFTKAPYRILGPWGSKKIVNPSDGQK